MNASLIWRGIPRISGTCWANSYQGERGKGKEEVELVSLSRATGPSSDRGCRGSVSPDKIREGEVPLVKGVIHFVHSLEDLFI